MDTLDMLALHKTIIFQLTKFIFYDDQTGFKMDLTHLDGHKFTITVDGVTECDHVMRVPGKGMPRRNGRGFGDLYITFEVDFPDKLSDNQKTKIREIFSSVKDEL